MVKVIVVRIKSGVEVEVVVCGLWSRQLSVMVIIAVIYALTGISLCLYLRTVSGSCGMAPFHAPAFHSSADGNTKKGPASPT